MKDEKIIEIKFKHIKDKLCMITIYNNNKKDIKKLNEKDKKDLFYALTNIKIFNKYKI